MFTKKIASLALAALMVIGGTGVTAFAAEPEVATVETGMTLEEFRASGMTLEGLRNVKENLDAKGVTLEDAKANFETMLGEFATAGGISIEEAQAIIAAFKADGKTFESLNAFKAELEAKGITLDEAKANFEGIFNKFMSASGLNSEEAKTQLSEIKANGYTLERLKNIQDIIESIPAI